LHSPAAVSVQRHFRSAPWQALDYHHVILHTDYLSTVSGGGYIGACVTAGMSRDNGAFPFGTSDIRDNDAIGHLRNYSNYLLPRARSQTRNLLEVAAVLLRGLIAKIGRAHV
jgi:hypothetical protein